MEFSLLQDSAAIRTIVLVSNTEAICITLLRVVSSSHSMECTCRSHVIMKKVGLKQKINVGGSEKPEI